MSMRDWPGLRRVFRLPPSDRRVRSAVSDELRFHIEGRIEELVSQGMSRADAEREAKQRFGDYRRIESEVQQLDRHAHRRRTFADRLEALVSDLRYSIRSLIKQPVFSGVVVATLTLGIAATTAIFHTVDRLVLHPLPYPDPDRIVFLGWRWEKGGGADALSPTKFEFWRAQSRVFDALATSQWFQAVLGDNAGAVVQGERVTSDYLRIIGARTAIGRVFSPEEYTLGAASVALIGDGFWHARLGGEPGVLGRQIRLDGKAYTVIGVMSPSFDVAESPDSWQVITPLAFTPEQLADGGNNFAVMGRLRAGVSTKQLKDDMAAVFERYRAARPDLVGKDDRGVEVKTYEMFLGDLVWELWIFLGATAFVLLLACANVANLLLARTLGRRKEFAVRAALGAGRGRIARQVVLEMLVLGGISAVLATGVSLLSLRGLVALADGGLLREAQLRLDPRVVVFTALVTLGASLVIGTIVAVSTARGGDLLRALSEGGRSGMSGRGQRFVRSALVSAEASLAMVLLAGAGLLVASFLALTAVDPGFQRDGVFVARISRAPLGYDSLGVMSTFERRVLEQLRATPGVEIAGATSTLPLERGWNLPMTVEGRNDASEGGMEWRSASAGYFKTIGVKVIAGRDILDSDDAGAAPVVVISQAFAKRHWPGESAIGHRVLLGRFKGRLIGPQFDEPAREIVGVVSDMKDMSLAQPFMRSTAWVPRAQMVRGLARLPSFAVRAKDPGIAASALRRAISEAEPRMPAPELTAMSDIVSASLSSRRFNVVLMGVFAALALTLTCVGIYGVVAYSVAQRVQEIGIRMALGARPGSVTRLVVLQGMRPAVIGLTIGFVAALALSRLLTKMLFRVGPHDPVPLAVVALLLVTVSGIASYLPARRASRVDPLSALRAD